MAVIFRGQRFKSVVEAAASIGADPVALHKELIRAGMQSAQPFYGDEGDGYIDEPEEKPGEEKRSQYQLIKGPKR